MICLFVCFKFGLVLFQMLVLFVGSYILSSHLIHTYLHTYLSQSCYITLLSSVSYIFFFFFHFVFDVIYNEKVLHLFCWCWCCYCHRHCRGAFALVVALYSILLNIPLGRGVEVSLVGCISFFFSFGFYFFFFSLIVVRKKFKYKRKNENNFVSSRYNFFSTAYFLGSSFMLFLMWIPKKNKENVQTSFIVVLEFHLCFFFCSFSLLCHFVVWSFTYIFVSLVQQHFQY